MESKWYLFEGQTLSNTKICDRAQALHVTGKIWQDINSHLDRKKRIQDALDKQEAHKKFLKEESAAMTKDWANSVENIRKRKEEERIHEIEQKREDRLQGFYRLRKEQEEQRKQFIEQAKKKIFMSSGYPKNLTSALVTSEILYERGKQLEFNEMLKKRTMEEERAYAEQLKKQIAEDTRDADDKQKRLERNRIYADELRKHIADCKSELLENREKQLIREAIDNQKATEEIELLKRLMDEEKLNRKKNAHLELKKCRSERLAKLKKDQEDEEELIRVTAIFNEAKLRTDCERKAKAKELREAGVKRRSEMSEKLRQQALLLGAPERLMLEKGIEELTAQEAARISAEAEHRAKIRKEIIDYRTLSLQQMAEQKTKDLELRKWEMLNRYKTADVEENYNKNRNKSLFKKILEYRQELLDQMSDDKARLIREKSIEDSVQLKNYAVDDVQFFQYASEVMQLAKSGGRNTYPIELVIKQYMKNNHVTEEESRKKLSEVNIQLEEVPQAQNVAKVASKSSQQIKIKSNNVNEEEGQKKISEVKIQLENVPQVTSKASSCKCKK